MNDEAAESRGPSGPSQDVPAHSAVPAETTPPAPSSPAPPPGAAPEEPTEPIAAAEPSAWQPPPGGRPEPDGPPGAPSTPPPPPPGTTPPPWPGGPTFSRDKLVRPRQGRYIAGVSGALGRATNTDPVLWRVLLAVLGILSGVGVLLYLIGWLVIPAEGESASPIESLLGKGRSGMAPLSVVLLGGAAVISFAFIVQDGMRAALLAAAVILGAVLLIKRTGGNPATFPGAGGGAPPPPPPGFPADPFGAAQPGTPPAGTAQFGTAPAGPPPPAPTPAAQPVTVPPAPAPPEAPTAGLPPMPPMPPMPPTPGGYRPPFAPHGPYARPAQATYPPQPPPPKPPKKKRERSKLGRLTFFAVVMVIGLLAVIDMAGASVAVSAYFAAALVTIALGLIVGAWFGRARGLIALALLASIGLAIATGTERFAGEVGNSVYRPDSIRAVADRYDFDFGNATLDLRGLDFTGQQQTITVTMKLGQLRVLVPETVDTTATVQMQNGRALIFGKEFDSREIHGQSVTDLGIDDTGGGTLKLDLQLDTGNMEVIR